MGGLGGVRGVYIKGTTCLNPNDIKHCEVSDLPVSKRNFSRHKGSLMHHNKLNGTYIAPGELFHCETCK